MPKVISYTPPWLSHPAPGARIFSDPEAPSPASPSKQKLIGTAPQDQTPLPSGILRPPKTIAHRGSEVFTVVGNKIRWADLVRVKDRWDDQNHERPSQSGNEDAQERAYRNLKTPVYYQITSLSVSPSGHFLAISTEHTIHVAFLPDSSRLHDGDSSEIKLKTFQLGPTTHVIPEAPLVSVLWHPLAASTPSADCLVTVTSEAAVRVWEFERSNLLSFERPALAIDLRKLANGTSSDQDFEPSGFGRSRGFSADAFEMEVAATCFGGRGAENEDPWAAMTLWVAMTNADVYALCPLLPEKWMPTPTTIPALTTSAVARIASMTADNADADERKAANQRYEWVLELDNDAVDVDDGNEVPARLRPENPSAVPRLQGPFELVGNDLDDDAEVVDMHVIPANLDEEDLYSGEDDYEVLGGAKYLPYSVVCLTTSANQVQILLECEGVTGQWLPKTGRGPFSMPTSMAGEFTLIETIVLQTEPQPHPAAPIFTQDLGNPYHFYVTTASNVLSLSLEDWAARVGSEVSEDISDGLESRLKLACRGPVCSKHNIISQTWDQANPLTLSAATLIEDPNVDTLVLSSYGGRAVAAQLDQSPLRTAKLFTNGPSLSPAASPLRASQSLMMIMQPEDDRDPIPTRAPYAPASIFYQDQGASIDQLKSRIPTHRRSMLTEKPLRLSPACLDVMTIAHRTFSHQTSNVEKAAGELFRRCMRLHEELADQVKAMSEIALKLNNLASGDGSDTAPNTLHRPTKQSDKFSDRIKAAKARQQDLFNRYERVRRKAGHAAHSRQDLSINEKSWINEIDTLARRVGADSGTTDHDQGSADTLATRVAEAKSLTDELVEDAQTLKDDSKDSSQAVRSGDSIPDGRATTSLLSHGGLSRFQRERIKEVMEMVEREAAVIEAVEGRLARLTTTV